MRRHLACIVGLALIGSTAAGADEWIRLGSRSVDFSVDRDTIDVRDESPLSALEFDVADGKLDVYNVRVTFGNGESFSPDTKVHFRGEGRSRVIDLPGAARSVRKVEFWYRTKAGRGRSAVTLLGRTGAGDGNGNGGGEGSGKDEVIEARWERLGQRQVDFAGERDVISAVGEGRFTAIKLEVEDANVDLYDVRVTFGDGELFSPETRLEFREGSRSRTIDLPGEARGIREVRFAYRSEHVDRRGRGRAGERATIVLYGKTAAAPGRSPEDRPAADPGTGDKPGKSGGGAGDRGAGWELIGSREVAFRAELDAISAAGDGRFSALRVEVEGGDLELFNVVVTFGNGDTHSPKTRLVFDQNTGSREFDLPGKSRVLRSVSFQYRSIRGGGEGRATVRVYGRH